MILLTYANVMKGLNQDEDMYCVCPHRNVTREIFENAIKLWHIEGATKVGKNPYEIQYLHTRLRIRFETLSNMGAGMWRGFRGVFLMHPDLDDFKRLSVRERETLIELDHANKRHQDKWHL